MRSLSERIECLAENIDDANHEELTEVFMTAKLLHEKFLSLYERPAVPRLTPREREVLLWAAEGRSDFDVSCILNVSASTIRFHWKNIFAKLGVRGRLRAVVKAMQLRMIEPLLIDPPSTGRPR
jgi:DNA-binding CsgD family transcriptional regulator